MPYQRPTLTQLRQDAAADITSNIPGADGLLRFSNLMVIGTALAGMANMHYGFLDWIAMQSNPYTATGEYLEAWAALKDVFRLAAVASNGTVTFTGNNGTDVPMGTVFVRGDQATFISTADMVVSSGTVTIPAVAQTPGEAGNTNASTVMSISQAIPGIISTGAVASAFIGGADTELDDSLRSRMLERYAAPPQGGDMDDYVTWALEINSVSRAWCVPNGQGAGTVSVYFMMDEAESAFSGFPQGTNGVATLEPRDAAATGDQLIVANYIFPLAPVTALIYALAPVAAPQNFTIAALNPSTPTIKAEIGAAISDTFFRLGTAKGGSIPFAAIEAAINAVPGLIDFIITSPTTDPTTTVGNLPTLGTITWV